MVDVGDAKNRSTVPVSCLVRAEVWCAGVDVVFCEGLSAGRIRWIATHDADELIEVVVVDCHDVSCRTVRICSIIGGRAELSLRFMYWFHSSCICSYRWSMTGGEIAADPAAFSTL